MDIRDRQAFTHFANLTIAMLLLILEALTRIDGAVNVELVRNMIKEQESLMSIMVSNITDVSRETYGE